MMYILRLIAIYIFTAAYSRWGVGRSYSLFPPTPIFLLTEAVLYLDFVNFRLCQLMPVAPLFA